MKEWVQGQGREPEVCIPTEISEPLLRKDPEVNLPRTPLSSIAETRLYDSVGTLGPLCLSAGYRGLCGVLRRLPGLSSNRLGKCLQTLLLISWRDWAAVTIADRC